MRLPSKPYATLPVYSLGPSAMVKGGAASAPAEPEKQPFGSGHNRQSRRSSVHKYATADFSFHECAEQSVGVMLQSAVRPLLSSLCPQVVQA